METANNKPIFGDVRVFATINTTEYNGDGRYAVQVTSYEEIESMGWRKDEKYIDHANRSRTLAIEEMSVGEILLAEEKGAYLMRLA